MKENDAGDYSNQDLSITYVNVTLKYPVQLIYANKNFLVGCICCTEGFIVTVLSTLILCIG
jgi:hypothetical protein